MSRLLACLLLVLFASAAVSAPAPPPRAPVLTWVFDTHEDKELIPQTKVYLKVGTQRVLILSKAQAGFRTLSRTDYKVYKIPAAALTACSGWFAGGGQDMYVIPHKKSLRVYRRWTDEQAPEFQYKRIRTLPLTGK